MIEGKQRIMDKKLYTWKVSLNTQENVPEVNELSGKVRTKIRGKVWKLVMVEEIVYLEVFCGDPNNIGSKRVVR